MSDPISASTQQDNSIRIRRSHLVKPLRNPLVPLASMLLIGITIRAIFFQPLPYAQLADVKPRDPGDASRFLSQARWLSEGHGFLNTRGAPCTCLPPGYPVFIVGVFTFTESLHFLIAVQLLLSLLSAVLLYLALRQRHRTVAAVAALLLAASPWIANYASRIMSETLGVFLIATFVYLLSLLERNRGTVAIAFLTGFVAIATCLTVPAVSVALAAICGVLVWRSRRRPETFAALVCGSLTVFIPWQIHCFQASGHLVPTLLTKIPSAKSGAFLWMRTWARSKQDFRHASLAFVGPNDHPDFDIVPNYAYRTEEERHTIETLARDFRNTSSIRADFSPMYQRVDREFQRIARERVANDPLGVYVLLPAARGWSLWTHMPDVGLASTRLLPRLSPWMLVQEAEEFGPARAVRRYLRALFSLAVWGVHIATLAMCLVFALGSLRSRSCVPWMVLFGTLAYTYISAYTVLIESRRNLPFLPLLLFLAFYCNWSGVGCGLREWGQRLGILNVERGAQ